MICYTFCNGHWTGHAILSVMVTHLAMLSSVQLTLNWHCYPFCTSLSIDMLSSQSFKKMHSMCFAESNIFDIFHQIHLFYCKIWISAYAENQISLKCIVFREGSLKMAFYPLKGIRVFPLPDPFIHFAKIINKINKGILVFLFQWPPPCLYPLL